MKFVCLPVAVLLMEQIFAYVSIFEDEELAVRVFDDSLVNPLFQNLKIGCTGFVHQETEQFFVLVGSSTIKAKKKKKEIFSCGRKEDSFFLLTTLQEWSIAGRWH
jgi:hypothetical protein